MIDKIKNWLIIILIALVGYYYVINAIKSSKLDKQSKQITELESKVEHLELEKKADVAANNEKAKLKDAMDSSKDTDNLNHVPDANILMQLRADPV